MTALIRARSKRQAMDWSLALVSQGIEPTIRHTAEDGWGLDVTEQDHEAALRIIRQYRIENLGWPWRPRISPGVVFDWASIGWVVLLAAFYFLQQQGTIRSIGLMVGDKVSNGQWWRLFTAMFLHADFAHLAANAGFGFLFLGLTMGRCGTGVGILASYLAGAGGNVFAWLMDAQHRSLGASGMVMGSIGLLAAQSFATPRSRYPRAWKYVAGGVIAGVMLFLWLGSNPESDLLAHTGGFVSGMLLGGVLVLKPQLARSAPANIAAGVAFALLVILTWSLALKN